MDRMIWTAVTGMSASMARRGSPGNWTEGKAAMAVRLTRRANSPAPGNALS